MTNMGFMDNHQQDVTKGLEEKIETSIIACGELFCQNYLSLKPGSKWAAEHLISNSAN